MFELILANVNPMTILYSALALLGLAFVFGLLLAILGKKLAVKEDERVSKIKKHLSGANCGACGFAGCDAFAVALVENKAELSDCFATSSEKKEIIGQILGVSVDEEESKIIVACAGGKNALDKYEYMGYGDCMSMELLSGGRKQCDRGCLGMESCTKACSVLAIHVKDQGYAVVNYNRCIACGKCVNTCPKDLIKRVPANAMYYVACSTCRKGKIVKDQCTVGCLGCGLCARICKVHAIEMKDNLPVFDYSKCINCGICAEKCPTKCIKKCDDM